MPGPRLVAQFETTAQFLHAYQSEIRAGGLLIHGAQLGAHAAVGPCSVVIAVKGETPLELTASIAAFVPNVGVAVLFQELAPLQALAARVAAGSAAAPGEQGAAARPAEPEPEVDVGTEEARPATPGTLSARLQAMTVSEKMQLALSGDREARTFLLRDLNKTLHMYVLRNPRVGLDEVTYAAKLSTLSPDALKFIAEHKEWGHNPTVCAAIARNPKTPVPLVLRILPRVPHQEIRAIAKGNGRAPIVQAARKMLNE